MDNKSKIIKKKKNAGGLKGKKKWASKLDASEIETKIEKLHDKRRTRQNKQKAESLGFEITVEEESEKVKPLEKDRFKKKDTEKNMNEKTLRRIVDKSKKIDQITKSRKIQEDIDQNSDNDIEDEQDIWENEEIGNRSKSTKVTKLIQKNKEVDNIKRVVTPHDGISINPSTKAYKELIDEAIYDEMDKDKMFIKHKESKKTQRQALQALKSKKRKKTKSVKVLLEQQIADAKKQEKLLNHQFLNIKNIKKQLNKDEQQQEQKREEIQQREKEIITLQEEHGIVKKGKKISNKQYEFKKDIITEEDIPENLRSVNQNQNLVRDQFDSIFRRGMLEQRTFLRSNNRKNKVPSRKKYGKNRDLKEGDEWMDENNDILPSTMEQNKKLSIQK